MAADTNSPNTGEPHASSRTPQGYVIRIVNERDQERALEAFLTVREAVHSVAEDEFVVTVEHLKALRREKIPFEDRSKPPNYHGKEKAG
jgi:hypothetical protein